MISASSDRVSDPERTWTEWSGILEKLESKAGQDRVWYAGRAAWQQVAGKSNDEYVARPGQGSREWSASSALCVTGTACSQRVLRKGLLSLALDLDAGGAAVRKSPSVGL